MSLLCYPYTSVSGDRKYSAAQEAATFYMLLSTGIISDGSSPAYKVAGSMNIKIPALRACITGHRVISDSEVTLPLDNGDASNPRIDIVALESNVNTAVRAARFVVVKGTAAVSPVAPALTNTSSIQQTPICQVRIPAGATSLDSATITDARVYAKGTHAHTADQIIDLESALASKQNVITGAATSILSSNLTTSMALVSDANGKVAAHASVTASELGCLDGVTGAIQTQLNRKLGKSGDEAITTENAVWVGLTIRGAPGQTAHLQDWTDSNEVALAYIDRYGGLTSNGLYCNNTLVVKNSVGQTGPIQTWADSNGIALAFVNNSGRFLLHSDVYIIESAYNTGHIVLGSYHLWVDTSGRLRIKYSTPTSATDGTVVGTQS